MQFKGNDSHVFTDILNVGEKNILVNVHCENECEGVQRDDACEGVHRQYL